MEIKLKGRKLSVNHVLKRNETYKFIKTSKWQTISIYKKPQDCMGYSSRCKDGRDILLIDYDNVTFDIVKSDISFLQNKYELPSAFVFYTNRYSRNKEEFGSYHVVFLSKHYTSEIIDMLGRTHADINYITMPFRNSYRAWVLRLSPKKNRNKPKFLMKVSSPYGFHDISSAHKKLLSLYYPKTKEFTKKYPHEDFETEYKINIYEAT